MEQLILVWVVFGAAAASMAKGKGRNVYLWMLIGVLIGPFAALIVGLMKKTETGDKKYD
ncbi:hypothetical protein [Geopsychrobacter electrodiphilus]|uniref:hypothetical protein n=1 Tax=Geopsychrobacter electrodiphilus TaxID=225196 RepID=UPI000363FB70|nr:hypothetical protein [Geopsychrobacter electrodiphilus]